MSPPPGEAFHGKNDHPAVGAHGPPGAAWNLGSDDPGPFLKRWVLAAVHTAHPRLVGGQGMRYQLVKSRKGTANSLTGFSVEVDAVDTKFALLLHLRVSRISSDGRSSHLSIIWASHFPVNQQSLLGVGIMGGD